MVSSIESIRRIARGTGMRGLVVGAVVGSLALGACGSQRPKTRRTDVPEPAQAPPAQQPAGNVVPLPGGPEGIVVDPSSGLVAVGLRQPAGIVVVDDQGRVVRQVPLSGPPRHLAFDSASGTVLVPVETVDDLVAVNIASGQTASSVKVGRQPHDAFAVKGRVFVGDELADTISVVEGDKVAAVLPGPVQPGGLAGNGRSLAVIGVRGRQLAGFDPVTLANLGTVDAGVGPTHIVAGPDGRYYVADTQGNQILVYTDQPKLARVARTAADGAPYGIAVDSVRRQLWVTLTARNEAVQYDIAGESPRLLATFKTVRQPNTVAVDSRTGRVFVTGSADGALQIIPAP